MLRIVHLLDWQFESPVAIASEQANRTDSALSDQERDQVRLQLVNETATAHQQQLAVLRFLIDQHQLERIHLGRVAAEDLKSLQSRAKAEFQRIAEEPASDRRMQLVLGAVWELYATGELAEVASLEEQDPFMDDLLYSAPDS